MTRRKIDVYRVVLIMFKVNTTFAWQYSVIYLVKTKA